MPVPNPSIERTCHSRLRRLRHAAHVQRLASRNTMYLRSYFVLAASLASAVAHAETVTVLGRALQLTPPDGFCILGGSPRETALLQMQTNNTAPAGVLAQFTVPCGELDDFRSGRIDNFGRWAQVLVLRRQGQLRPVSESRDEFVRATASNVATQSVDFGEIDRRLNQYLSKSDAKVTMSVMQPIGVKDSAFFTTMQMMVQSGEASVPTVAVVAITVANHLPVAVQVYGTPRASSASLSTTAAAYAKSVVAQN